MNTCESCLHWERVTETWLGHCKENKKGYPYGVHGFIVEDGGYFEKTERRTVVTGKDFGCLKYEPKEPKEPSEYKTEICDCDLCKRLKWRNTNA